jgi:hypothetical protein
VVVRAAVTVGRHVRQKRWPLPRATVLLAGIAVLPSQTGSHALLLPGPGLQIAAIEGLATTGAEQSPRRSLPGLQMHPIEELGAGSQARASSSTAFGSFVSPIGSADSALSIALGWSGPGLQQTQVLEPAAIGPLIGAGSAGAEAFGVGDDGSAPIIGGAAPSGIHPVCTDDQTAMRLQAGGKFRVAQTLTAAPVQFPPGVFTGTSLDIANSLGDPTLGPGGDRSNLTRAGPAGSWCRPLSEPFAQDNPLASRAFWTPFALALIVVVVFLLSRGVKIPA